MFIGRFHPIMVHLPIGMFMLGYLFEVLHEAGFKNLIPSRKIVVTAYIIGWLSGVAAVFTGWLLSNSKDYGIDALNDHKWLGIATLLVMLIVIIYQFRGAAENGKMKLAGSTVVIVLTTITGHYGGNLTHGSTYLLEYGPTFLQPQDARMQRIQSVPPDSLQVYGDFIQPLIRTECYACHNKEENYGGLILERYADLFKEANREIPVVAGSPEKSELFRRVSLPRNHEKVMPPRGNGFNYTDIQILRYWILMGADSIQSFLPEKMNPELITLIQRDYGIDYAPKPYFEKVKVDTLGQEIIRLIRSAGFGIRYLGETNYLLDISFKNDTIGIQQIEMLNQIADHVTFLTLSNCQLTDDLVEKLAPMPHLTRIDWSNNELTGKVVSFLTQHEHIEAVNLNGTQMDASSIEQLLEGSSAKRIYVFNTDIQDEELASLRLLFQEKEIISQFEFTEVSEAKSVFEQMQETRE